MTPQNAQAPSASSACPLPPRRWGSTVASPSRAWGLGPQMSQRTLSVQAGGRLDAHSSEAW